jgi:hypothetical protein
MENDSRRLFILIFINILISLYLARLFTCGMLARGWRGLRLGAVVLDVDGTLTRRDTIEDVIAAAIDGAARRYSAAAQQRRDEQGGEGGARPGDEEDAVRQSKRHEWAGLKEAYAGPYGTFLDHLLPPQRTDRTASLLQHHLLEEERVVRLSPPLLAPPLDHRQRPWLAGALYKPRWPCAHRDRSTSRCGGWRLRACSRA